MKKKRKKMWKKKKILLCHRFTLKISDRGDLFSIPWTTFLCKYLPNSVNHDQDWMAIKFNSNLLNKLHPNLHISGGWMLEMLDAHLSSLPLSAEWRKGVRVATAALGFYQIRFSPQRCNCIKQVAKREFTSSLGQKKKTEFRAWQLCKKARLIMSFLQ